MAHTRKTLLLDSNWDLCLDKAGRIAVAEGPYATAQAVANECRLFTDDAYFEPQRGIRLGQLPRTGKARPRNRQRG